MYFSIYVKYPNPDPHFSWIISKHPDNTFRRDLSGHDEMRVVTGRFDENGTYRVQVTNDPISYLEALRKHNAANYLDAAMHAVCPENLKGLSIVFKSAIDGKNSAKGEISDEDFLAPKTFCAALGPFPYGREKAVETFASAGIQSVVLDGRTTEAFTLILTNEVPCSVTEFLQKVYILSFYLTHKVGHQSGLTDDQVTRLVKLCRTWIDRLSHRDRIIKGLSGYRPSLMGKFEAGLTDRDEDDDDHDAPPHPVDPERRLSLHELRHNLILDQLQDGQRIIDLGCAEGKLIHKICERFPKSTVIGIDADQKRVWRARKNTPQDRVRVIHSNLLYPELSEPDLRPDVLILSEVIEHLEESDRVALLELVMNTICPKQIILTTPNVEYNERFGMERGQYRHWDHRIEYTSKQFHDEVMARLCVSYDTQLVNIVEEEDVQPSFFLVCVAVENDVGNTRGLRQIGRFYAPFTLDVTNYNVSRKEIHTGSVSSPFLRNANDIFYLGPTIAPVDYDDRFPGYLEHPQAAFDYYRERGVKELIAEYKYMGSRAYIAVFKDITIANLFGMTSPIVINSRNGIPFFEPGDARLDQIYSAIQPKMTSDLLLLDAEILPWSIKSEKLIRKDFLVPGEVALLDRMHTGVGLDNAKKFLAALSNYTREHELYIRPFHVLAQANVNARGRVKDLQLGFHTPHREQLHIIQSLSSINVLDWGTLAAEFGLFGSCSCHKVNLSDPDSMKASVYWWETYCATGGEGFVYKPANGIIVQGQDGYYKQPALKVRGRDYLRLIYGIDYLEPEWFNKLKRRNTRRKRQMAVQQQELAQKILLAFLHKNDSARKQYVAAFLGVEDINYNQIDRTL